MRALLNGVRVAVGVITLSAIGLAYNYILGIVRLPRATELSAIQIASIYAEGCFLLIAAVGVAISAYIATRWD